jgi:hypothetical protein
LLQLNFLFVINLEGLFSTNIIVLNVGSYKEATVKLGTINTAGIDKHFDLK